MKILVDILHAAHIHRLKNFIWKAQKEGDEILITARNKEVVAGLLNYYNLPFVDTGPLGSGIFGKVPEYTRRTFQILKLARQFKPTVLVSGDGFSIGPVGRLLGIPSVSVSDVEDQGMIPTLAYHIVSHIVTPYAFRRDFGKKHVRFPGFYEMTYLNDQRFVPDQSVLKELGVRKGDIYFILRLVSWESVHDTREQGLTLEQQRLVFKELAKHGRVFITTEGVVPEEFAPYTIVPRNMHSVLYYSSLYFGDSQTMSIEAGLLGVPSIRCNSLVDKLHAKGEFDELQHKYGIVYSYSDFENAFTKMKELLAQKDLKQQWRRKRQRIILETEDFTDWFFAYIHREFAPKTQVS